MLSSANGFNLDQSQILLFGKELECFRFADPGDQISLLREVISELTLSQTSPGIYISGVQVF